MRSLMIYSHLQSLFWRWTQAEQHRRCTGLKSRRMETYRGFCWGKLKRPFSRLRCRWDDNIKEKIWEGVYCIHLVRDRRKPGARVTTLANLPAPQCGELLTSWPPGLYFMGFVNLRMVGREHINFYCHILYILSSYHKYIISFPHQTRYKIISSRTLQNFSCIL